MSRSRVPVRDPRLKPCPFCGGAATIQPWHGGGPAKRLVTCDLDNECPVSPGVTGSTAERARKAWNRRVQGVSLIEEDHGPQHNDTGRLCQYCGFPMATAGALDCPNRLAVVKRES